MDLKTAIEVLEKHNEWRRDENIPPKTDMQNPTDIGNAIDFALIELKKLLQTDVISCTCKMPLPVTKCSENGINSYCTKCRKEYKL